MVEVESVSPVEAIEGATVDNIVNGDGLALSVGNCVGGVSVGYRVGYSTTISVGYIVGGVSVGK